LQDPTRNHPFLFSFLIIIIIHLRDDCDLRSRPSPLITHVERRLTHGAHHTPHTSTTTSTTSSHPHPHQLFVTLEAFFVNLFSRLALRLLCSTTASSASSLRLSGWSLTRVLSFFLAFSFRGVFTFVYDHTTTTPIHPKRTPVRLRSIRWLRDRNPVCALPAA